jgi:hypothetical protein
LFEDTDNTWDTDGGFAADTVVAKVIKGVQTICTVLWWDITDNKELAIMVEGGDISFAANGRIDAASIDRLTDAIHSVYESANPNQIYPVVDSSGTTFWWGDTRHGAATIAQYGDGYIGGSS